MKSKNQLLSMDCVTIAMSRCDNLILPIEKLIIKMYNQGIRKKLTDNREVI